MRTSPTNIGLQLLATVSACDLGFITIESMTARLELAFRALERMRRFRGHFYNWYDLTDLRVLEPAYISTVDSGNLAGHLIALRQACLELRTGRRLRRAGSGEGWTPASRSPVERLSDFASAAPGGFATARARRAVLPRPHLREARAAIAAAGIAGGAGSFDALARPLELARAALAEAAPDAVEWIEWCSS